MKLAYWITAVLLVPIVSTALWSSKTVKSIVGASHLVRHGEEVTETRLNLMKDHRLYVEEITQRKSSGVVCKVSLTVLPEAAFVRIISLENSQLFKDNSIRKNPDGEGSEDEDTWHIVFRDGRTRFFSFESPQLRPPSDFITWFDSARSLKPLDNVQVDTGGRCELFSQQMADSWQH